MIFDDNKRDYILALGVAGDTLQANKELLNALQALERKIDLNHKMLKERIDEIGTISTIF